MTPAYGANVTLAHLYHDLGWLGCAALAVGWLTLGLCIGVLFMLAVGWADDRLARWRARRRSDAVVAAPVRARIRARRPGRVLSADESARVLAAVGLWGEAGEGR